MKVNKKILLGSTAAMVALSPMVAEQAQAAVATVGANAVIAAAISLTGTVAMDFGVLSEAGAGGTAALNFADALTPGAGITAVGGTPSSGHVNIKATTGIPITVAAPNTIILTGPTANTMTVNSIDLQRGAANGTDITYTAVAATETLDIDGTLNIGAAQKTGTYAGTITVTVLYQ